MTALPYISPQVAKRMQEQGAILVDIRQADEFQREHIPSARLFPLADRATTPQQSVFPGDKTVIFYCLSGLRCKQYSEQLKALAPPTGAFVLEGGLNAWKSATLSVEQDRSQPLPIMRQVQIITGSLSLLGVALGYALHPAFFILSVGIGLGLVFAGISGFCGLAKLLMLMPWNRISRAS